MQILSLIKKYSIIIISAISLLIFISIPFLHNVLNDTVAQWLWYPSCVVFIILIIIGLKKDDEPFGNSKIERISNISTFWAIPVLPSIFVFNYYDIAYIWKWVIFAYAFILIPISFYFLYQEDKPEEATKKLPINALKSTVLYWLFDLLYMSIFNDWLIGKFVFGILAIIIIFINSADVFLHGVKSYKFFLVVELLIGLGLSAYLIYIIPDDKMQTIVLSIAAALIGGLFTLLGVAWTIKQSERDRKADLWRIEKERKEEERKKYIPYIRLANEVQAHYAGRVSSVKHLNFDNPNEISSIENNTYYAIMINHFTVKNISESNIILKGIYLDNVYHPFDSEVLVERDSVGQIQFPLNHWYAFANKISSVVLIVTDIIGNKYSVPCDCYKRLDAQPIKNLAPNNLEYTVLSYTYTVESIALPKLIEEDSNE